MIKHIFFTIHFCMGEPKIRILMRKMIWERCFLQTGRILCWACTSTTKPERLVSITGRVLLKA